MIILDNWYRAVILNAEHLEKVYVSAVPKQKLLLHHFLLRWLCVLGAVGKC